MPGRLQGFAKHQPVSIVIDAVRSLTYGGPFPSTGKVFGAIAWSVAIIAVAAPLAVRMYRRKAATGTPWTTPPRRASSTPLRTSVTSSPSAG